LIVDSVVEELNRDLPMKVVGLVVVIVDVLELLFD
jgi:hypothetical protein